MKIRDDLNTLDIYRQIIEDSDKSIDKDLSSYLLRHYNRFPTNMLMFYHSFK
ncbi:hypothetical protein ABIB40_004173 [Pedobacter sp. UYP30]